MKRETLAVVLFMAILSGIVVTASELMGGDRRLPPRDYVPLLIATVVTIVAMVRDREA
jgi:hypothetical protein